MASAVNTPTCKWAQRPDLVYFSIILTDVQNPRINVTTTTLNFSGDSRGTAYSIDLEFFDELVPEECKYSVQPRGVTFLLHKKEKKNWSSLLKDKNMHKTHIQVDWDRWVDSDDEEAEGKFDFGDMDWSNLMSQGGGLGNDNDSDNEDLPDLEDDSPQMENTEEND